MAPRLDEWVLQPFGSSIHLETSQVTQSSSWWSLDLGDAMLAGTACEQIKDQFRTVHTAASQPLPRAVFTRSHSGDLHCQVIAYFTPSCAPLAARLGAEPCARPVRAGLELLAGAASCWDVLFESS